MMQCSPSMLNDRDYIAQCAITLIHHYRQSTRILLNLAKHDNTYIPNLQQLAFYGLIKDLDFAEEPMNKLMFLSDFVCSRMYDLGIAFDNIKTVLRLLTTDFELTEKMRERDYCFMCDSSYCFRETRTFEGIVFGYDSCVDTGDRVFISSTYARLVEVIHDKNVKDLQTLMLSGDVELNPGPVMSKFEISESGFRTLRTRKRIHRQNNQSYVFRESGVIRSEIKRRLLQTQKINKIGVLQPGMEYDPRFIRKYVAQGMFDHQHQVKVKLGLDDDVMAFVTMLTTQVSHKISSAKQFVSTACKLFLISRNYKDKISLAVLILDLLMTWGIPMTLAQQAWTWISKNCKELFDFTYKAQSIVDSGCLRAVSMLVTCILSILGSTALPSQKLIDTVLKRTGDVGRATQGLKTMMDTIGSVFDSVYNQVYEFIFGLPPNDDALNALLNDVHVWFKEVDTHSRMAKIDDIPVNYKTCRDIERLYTQGLDFVKRLDTMRVSQQHREPFNRYWTVLQKLYDKVINYGSRQAEPRTEPVVIRLFGNAGVGKSGLVFLLCQDICGAEGLASEFWHEIYFRNVFQEFWDGYHGQMISVIDDFGQVADSLGNINKEFLEVIKCKNVAKWPLYMSSLEQKARTNFTSRALILTSNQLNYNTPSLTCKDALARRMDITVEVQIKPKYRVSEHDNKLDTRKVSSSLDPDVYQFLVYKHDKPTGQILDYDQFSAWCLKEYNDSFKVSTDRINLLTQRGKFMDEQYKFEQKKKQNEAKKLYRAQLELELTADRCINPTIWMSTRVPACSNLDDQLVKDNLVNDEQREHLRMLACSSESYNEFMHESYLYCLDQDIDLLAVVSSKFNYSELSDRIYKENLTMNKRNNNKFKFVDTLFYRFKESINETYNYIKENAGSALIIFGGIMTGVMALYGAKRLFESRKGSESIRSRPIPKEHVVPGCMAESRDEKRPRKIMKRECLKAESRDEKRSRKAKRLEFRPEFLTKCTCNLDAIEYVCKDKFIELVKGYANDKRFVCNTDGDGEFCLRCFGYHNELWMDIFVDRIKEHKLTCMKHSAEEQADDVFDNLVFNSSVYFAQAIIDTNAKELTYGPVAGNLYKIATKTPDGWKDRVNGLFVRGTIMLTVQHVKEFLEEECCIYNSFVPDGLLFRKSDCQFIELTNKKGDQVDAMLMVLPGEINLHRDLVSNFVNESDISRFEISPGNLIHLRHLKNNKRHSIVFGQFAIRNIKAIEREEYWLTDSNGQSVPYVVRGGYEYPAETDEGDCGSPLVLSNQRCLGKIAGIHIAGAASSSDCSALSTAVNRNMIERGIDKVTSYRAQLKLDLPYDKMPDMPEGNFVPIGKYPLRLPSPTKSMYSKSPIHDEFSKIRPTKKRPAALKPVMVDGVKVDPLMKGISKCGTVTPLVDKELLSRCVTALANKLKKNRDATVRRPLTPEEAIRGIEGDNYITSINRRSSAGVPWSFNTDGKPGKQKWLGNDENFIVDNPELMEKLKERLIKAKSKERVETIWADTLKDELRPHHKVDVGKTRVFSAGSMDYVIFMRQYYLPFFAHMMRNRIDNFSAVGINPFDVDWDRLVAKLKSKGLKNVAGDYEGYDSTQLAIFLWAVLEVINLVEDDSEENKLIRLVIFAEVVNSLHLYKDNLYAWTHSLTSGNPGTAIINTIYNILVTMYVFCKCTGLSPIDFFKYVYMIAFGDDNALCISDQIIDRFNQMSMAEQFSVIGMKYTDEDKTGNMVPYRTLDEIGFLKRKFRFDSTLVRYVAPLDLDSILDMTMWVTNGCDPQTLCISNIDRAYHELAIHGPGIFDKWTRILDTIAHATFEDPPILGCWLDYVGKDFGY